MSGIFIRRKSSMIWRDWRAPRCNARSMVIIDFPCGLFISQAIPSMIKSGVFDFGVSEGGISSIFWPRSRKNVIVASSCCSKITLCAVSLPCLVLGFGMIFLSKIKLIFFEMFILFSPLKSL